MARTRKTDKPRSKSKSFAIFDDEEQPVEDGDEELPKDEAGRRRSAPVRKHRHPQEARSASPGAHQQESGHHFIALRKKVATTRRRSGGAEQREWNPARVLDGQGRAAASGSAAKPRVMQTRNAARNTPCPGSPRRRALVGNGAATQPAGGISASPQPRRRPAGRSDLAP